MRKLYALLAGICMTLLAVPSNATPDTPDVAGFTFSISAPGNTVFFTNTTVLGNEPGIRKAFWSFGDGATQLLPPLANTQHQYLSLIHILLPVHLGPSIITVVIIRLLLALVI